MNLSNIFSIDVEDWFHILDTADAPSVDEWAGGESRVRANTHVLLDELDWPMFSASTAYLNDTAHTPFADIISGPVNSLYKLMRENNRCMHRDYQNLGVNGARSSSMAHGLISTIARDATSDYPIWGLFELIGNDVCSGHPGTSHMTTPEEFYANNMESFGYLDIVLPTGSRIITM